MKDFELEEIGNNEWRLKTFIGFDTPECIEIPAEIDGKKIVEIGEKLFLENKTIKQLKIAQGITTIGTEAFYNCHKLGDVEFPESIHVIGDAAFAQCWALELSGTLPKKLVKIGDYAFSSICNMRFDGTCIFPKSIKNIGEEPFFVGRKKDNSVNYVFLEGCEATLRERFFDFRHDARVNLYIPASVKVEEELFDGVSIYNETFVCFCQAGSSAMKQARKRGLKCADYDKALKEFMEKEEREAAQKKEKETKEARTKEENRKPFSERDFVLPGDFSPDQERVVIPARIKTIRKDAFRSKSILKSITFEVGSVLEVIEEGAFADRKMGMEMICIPKSVKKIGKNAFCAGTWLEQEVRVQICFEEGSLLEEIGEGAFRGLSSAKFQASGESKYTSPLYELKLPKHIHTIGEGAFESNVGISKVDMSVLTELHTIPKNLFHYCFGLKQVLLPPNCEMIQSGAFDGGDFRRVEVPFSCKRIELYAFKDSIKEIVIPENCHFGQNIYGKVIRQNITIKPGEESAPKGGFMSKLKNFFGQLKD